SSGSANFSVSFPTDAAFTQFVTATATDSDNNTSEFSQAHQVRTPPVIAAQPTAAMNSTPGQPATFSVGATNSSDGSTFIYQWRLNGVNIPGGTSAEYTTPPAGLTT